MISPRCYRIYHVNSDGGPFSVSIYNSFPDLIERVNFLNKFYQVMLCHQLPHKARKLVVVGESDSGKSSWANVFLGLIPESKVAVLTKEKSFGASMIGDDTQLLYMDEWNQDMVSSDLLKTLLQGGYFPQSIKHKSPKMQTMNAGVYITCNNLPHFGEEDANVKRRLSIYHTKTLEVKDATAPQWIRDNAFECLLWISTILNCNEEWLDPEERFYEISKNTSANATLKSNFDTGAINTLKLASSSSACVLNEQIELDDTIIIDAFDASHSNSKNAILEQFN